MGVYIRVKTKEIKNNGQGMITGKEELDGKTKDNKRNDMRVKSE